MSLLKSVTNSRLHELTSNMLTHTFYDEDSLAAYLISNYAMGGVLVALDSAIVGTSLLTLRANGLECTILESDDLGSLVSIEWFD